MSEVGRKDIAVHVKAGLQRNGYKHPIIEAFNSCAPEIQRFMDGYLLLEEPIARYDYTKEHLEFMAEALKSTPPYSLDPLELITIGTRMIREFPAYPHPYPRIRLAGMVVARYIGGNSVPGRAINSFLKDARLPEEMLNTNIEGIHSRLVEVYLNHQKVVGCIDGAYYSPVLAEIGENFGNGMSGVYAQVKQAWKKHANLQNPQPSDAP